MRKYSPKKINKNNEYSYLPKALQIFFCKLSKKERAVNTNLFSNSPLKKFGNFLEFFFSKIKKTKLKVTKWRNYTKNNFFSIV